MFKGSISQDPEAEALDDGDSAREVEGEPVSVEEAIQNIMED